MNRFAKLSLAIFLSACAAAPAPSRSDEVNGTPEGETPTDNPPVELEDEPTEETPAALPKSLTGTLATGPVAKYGGTGEVGDFCAYSLAFKDIAIDIQDPGGAKPSATVKNVITESTPKCSYAVPPPATQQFTATAATKTATGFKVTFTQTKESPVTSLTAEVVAKGTSYEAQLTWKRLDQAEKLRWTATATVPLQAKP